jgi:purine nucleoside phosphorylase
MGRLAVIGGTGVRNSALAHDAAPLTVEGVTLHDAGDFVLLQRHGFDRYVRAHEIDHAANVRALAAAGCDRVLGLSSTGSLRVDWPVGTVVCPDDFYAPQVNPTVHDDGRSHTVPGFDRPWRSKVLDVWRAKAGTPIVDGGVYTQTRGPRFETAAEVRALAKIGDLVGMTIAAECILGKELGLAYAAVCVVDNLANGLDAEPLTVEEFAAAVLANQTALLADLAAVLPALGTDC